MSGMRGNQRDLFATEITVALLQPAIRSRLKPLLQSLLTEAAGTRPLDASAAHDSKEGGDEQDHA